MNGTVSARDRSRRRGRGDGPLVCAALAAGLCGAFLLTSLTAPTAVHAQVIRAEDDRYVTPQRFAVELRFGPYTPDIDGEFKGSRAPYQEFFGAKDRLMSQIEFDYQFLRHYGSAGVGLGVGYFTAEGKNRLASTGALSADTSSLKLIPFSLSAVYRFDWPLERYKIPLVPYGKLGLDYVIWSVSNGNGNVPEDPAGGTGRGGTWGWHAAVGVSLLLDIFDPGSARKFDMESGINHTHLFFELGHWDVSGLGAANKLHVGDNTWMAGLLFEF
ncbi:MAG: MXAN_2562 family outer membrane beta-barrel protein [Haliangium ochraceum]